MDSPQAHCLRRPASRNLLTTMKGHVKNDDARQPPNLKFKLTILIVSPTRLVSGGLSCTIVSLTCSQPPRTSPRRYAQCHNALVADLCPATLQGKCATNLGGQHEQGQKTNNMRRHAQCPEGLSSPRPARNHNATTKARCDAKFEQPAKICTMPQCTRS